MSFIPVFDQAWIDRALDRIRSGKTLVISTIYNATRIDLLTLKKFEKVDKPLLKIDSRGHLYLAKGKRFEDVTYCKLEWWDLG